MYSASRAARAVVELGKRLKIHWCFDEKVCWLVTLSKSLLSSKANFVTYLKQLFFAYSQEEDLRNEVLQFSTNCPECNAPAQTNMKLVQIPHFKEVIIMATNCEYCGHRTNEVKSGGAVEPLGTRITLRITDPSDMTRDLLKSETCSVEIPELEFELGMAIFGGKFTTLEGLLKDIRDLVTKNPFTLGDSSNPGQVDKLQEFSQKLDQIMEGKMKAHFIMNDPAGNSYLQNVYAPEDDPEMKVERYKRTFDQNEELGLNDMKTEGYEAGLAPR